MKRGPLVWMLVLIGAGVIAVFVVVAMALGLTDRFFAHSTAQLSVTSGEGAEQTTEEVSLSDLACRTSSVSRVISSASVNDAEKQVLLATAPTDGRDAYAITVWLDGRWFVSSAEFDASGSTVVFDALPGFVGESPDGGYPASAGVEATLSGTITCD